MNSETPIEKAERERDAALFNLATLYPCMQAVVRYWKKHVQGTTPIDAEARDLDIASRYFGMLLAHHPALTTTPPAAGPADAGEDDDERDSVSQLRR